LTMVVVDLNGQQVRPPVFFNSGGFDGKQARLRRQIDELKAKRDRLAKGDAQYAVVQAEIDACWLAYGRRNRALAHLASNLLIIVALAYDCQMIVGEDLASLRTLGRGRDARGRWRHWRNNTTLRSAITDLLRYKTRLAGLRLRFEFPRGTSHTCPRCGKAARTFKSSALDAVNSDWGAWLRCENADCAWNGSRDYAAALNIARLGVAYVLQLRLGKRRMFRMTTDRQLIQSVSYKVTEAALPFPSQSLHVAAPAARTRVTVAGWPRAVRLRPWPFLRPATGQCVDCYP
jgi:putative transposase